MSVYEPIRSTRESFDQQAADRLRGQIVAGLLAPGDRLTEASLAAEIGVSRSTMRTALLHLVSEGLVERQAYSAWKVASLTPDDAWEVNTLRKDFDGLAAELAAQRIDGAGREALGEAMSRIKALVHGEDRLALAYADADFHAAIVEISGHVRLQRQYRLIYGAALFYIARVDLQIIHDDEANFIACHQEICDAICSADAKRARALAEEHVERYGPLVAKHLNTGAARSPSKPRRRRHVESALVRDR